MTVGDFLMIFLAIRNRWFHLFLYVHTFGLFIVFHALQLFHLFFVCYAIFYFFCFATINFIKKYNFCYVINIYSIPSLNDPTGDVNS